MQDEELRKRAVAALREVEEANMQLQASRKLGLERERQVDAAIAGLILWLHACI